MNTQEKINLLAEIRAMVLLQAADEGLWFISETASESYLQQELRKLHFLIEGGSNGRRTKI